jgi:uncharacterized membrane protein
VTSLVLVSLVWPVVCVCGVTCGLALAFSFFLFFFFALLLPFSGVLQFRPVVNAVIYIPLCVSCFAGDSVLCIIL